eukprot:TRINITY_DN1579_c0_g1_i1.p1 TRINITY_DN1579_c0_g1~~TRINITY_DN1579_c0_g1_i1.p1  ORF type:complete len:406 (+),score=63.90 TRINITY_DN1579_c0_g1_i1:40-1218(+)
MPPPPIPPPIPLPPMSFAGVSEKKISANCALPQIAASDDRPILYDKDSQYVHIIEGPIMLTAPHGLELFRGGALGERKRVHWKERWVSEIVLKMSQGLGLHMDWLMGSSSFMVWNSITARKQDPSNLDPNYLIADDFDKSDWHQTLIKWKKSFEGTGIPLLHIDVHGKVDRKDNLAIDVGCGAMEELWTDRKKETSLLKKTICDELQKSLEGRRTYGYKQLKMVVEREPELRGWNNRGFHTMAHQSVLLGIPAIQLELPKTVRRALLVEQVLLDKFTKAIANTYRTVFGKKPLRIDNIPPHYPPTYKKHTFGEGSQAASSSSAASTPKPRAVESPSEAAARMKKARFVKIHALRKALPPPKPPKPTRTGALCRQLLREMDQLSMSPTEDKMI